MGAYKVIKSEKLSEPWQARYVVVDVETEKVLDDAQGYGYRSKQKAHAAWAYKNNPNRQAKAKQLKAIQRWIDSKSELRSELENAAWYAVDDGMSFTVADVQDVLDHLHIESPYTAKEIYKAFTK